MGMMMQETLDLVRLHSLAFQEGFMDAIREHIYISEPLPLAEQSLVYVVHFDM